MKPENLTAHEDLVEASLADPDYRVEWERTSFAHAVAVKVIDYRVQHHLTQTELGRRLGMRQPHVARLEAGDHEPSLATLQRLSSVLGIEFHIDITPDRASLRA